MTEREWYKDPTFMWLSRLTIMQC